MNVLQNATALELVWAAFTLYGLFYTSRNAHDAWLDFKVIKTAGVSNGRFVLASSAVRIESFRALAMLGWFTAGGVAMLNPTPQSQMFRSITIGLLIFGMVLTAVNSRMDHRARQKVVKAMRVKVAPESNYGLDDVSAFAPDEPPPGKSKP